MGKEFVATEVSIILFNSSDVLTVSGEDDAIVKDESWTKGTYVGSDFEA